MSWKRQVFTVKTRGESGPVDRRVRGWAKGLFAMDRRFYDDVDESGYGWVITHLPTGFIVRAVKGSLPVAKKLADELLALDGGWDFTDINKARNYGPRVKDVMSRHPGVLVDSSVFFTPTFVD